jgi:accessory Sec system S-layer assembly protein
MLSIFKNKRNKQETNELLETSSDSQDNKNEKVETEGGIKTTLKFPSDWQIPIQERYVYQFHHQQLFPLRENQISISGVELFKDEEIAVITAFIRNTLPKAIRLEKCVILLLDEDKNVLARKNFDLKMLGEITSLSSVPYRLVFGKDGWLVNDIPDQGWSIAFELKKEQNTPHQLQLHESWNQMLSDVQKTELESLVQNLPQLKPNEVNFMGLEVKKQNSQLSVTLLIRNGSSKNIKLEHLPLYVEDANGVLVARGAFNLENFDVKANTSKPWTFIFPEGLILADNPDLSKWKVYPPKNA